MTSSDHLAVDVAVVGAGASGLAAAVSAAEHGASVVVLEKNPDPGGTTALSVGSFSASETSLQSKAGISDSVDDHFEDMGKFAGDLADRDNLELRRLYVDNGGSTLEWLRSHGIEFFGPMPEPPHRVPRMHNVLPNSRAYIYWLRQAAERRGVLVLTRSRVQSLLKEGGRVIGLEYDGASGQRQAIPARRGVILAAGDFSSSPELKREHLGHVQAEVPGINPTSTGDGIRLGLQAGGYLLNEDLAYGPELRFDAPPRRLLVQLMPPARIAAATMRAATSWMPDWMMRPVIMSFATTHLAPSLTLFDNGAILVNREGRRFVDERDRPWAQFPDQTDGEAFIVFGQGLAARLVKGQDHLSTAPGIAYAYLSDYRRNRKDIYHEAESLERLAQKIGVPADALEESMAASGEGGDGLSSAPFHALGPVRAWMLLTEGGLAVTTELSVRGSSGAPIPGLYAAGSNGQGGLLLSGHGNHIGWAMVSGRIAGQSAAASPAVG